MSRYKILVKAIDSDRLATEYEVEAADWDTIIRELTAAMEYWRVTPLDMPNRVFCYQID